MHPVQSLNHIGIAVRSIDSQREFYEQTLGACFDGIEELPDDRIRVCFYTLSNVRLELLEPTDPASPVAKFIEKRGEGLHHLAFAVEDIGARIQEWKESGLRMIDDQPRSGAHGMQIAFAHPKSTHGVLMEICEPASE